MDRRLLPARADVAAAHLKGKVQAARFVEGAVRQVKDGVSALRETPSFSSRLETQLLRGERFVVYDVDGPWAWGQTEHDGYVGYLPAESLTPNIVAPTHRVSVLRTIVFPEPDIKSTPPFFLSLNAKVAVERIEGRFAKIEDGYAVAAHLAPIDAKRGDWVGAAELFINTPYLWGGRDSFGIDCSGLVQTSLETAGVQALRDTDLQETTLGSAIPLDAPRQRGDLIYWDGHVGIMLDAERLLHANAYAMCVSIEPLAEAAARIAKSDGNAIRTIRRP